MTDFFQALRDYPEEAVATAVVLILIVGMIAGAIRGRDL